MSLKSKFKVSSKLASEGVWIKFTDDDEVNADGTYPKFKIARMSSHNKKYALAVRRASRDMPKGSSEEANDKADKIFLNIFLDDILLEWADFEPNNDGVKLEYTRENAWMILSDPEWLDLSNELTTQSQEISNFSDERLEEDLKN